MDSPTIAMHPRGTVHIHRGQFVFIPNGRTHAISRHIPGDVPFDGVVDYLNDFPVGYGFPEDLEHFDADDLFPWQWHGAEPYVFYHLGPLAPPVDRVMHTRETDAFEQALESLGPGLKKIYLYNWYSQPEKTEEVKVHLPSAKVHLDLSFADPDHVARHTTAVGPMLAELKLPFHSTVQSIEGSRVLSTCGNLTQPSRFS